MQAFKLEAKVQRVVTDYIDLNVQAESEHEAYMIAARVLNVFPQPTEEPNVVYCYVTKRTYDLVSVEELKEKEDRGVG